MRDKKSKDQKIPAGGPVMSPGFMDIVLDSHGFRVTLGIVVLLALVIFRDFILGRLYYLFTDIASDSVATAFPAAYHTAQYLRTEGFPFWSFYQGMGQNIMAGSIADPFSLIVALAGPQHAAYSVIWMELAKILVAAAAFYHFLGLIDFRGISRIIGTVLYCFSGFMFVGGQWWVFSTEASYLAVLLLSFELLSCRNSWYLFPVAVALIAVHSPFELYTSSFILFIYFLFRHLSAEQPTLRAFTSRLLQMVCLGALGVLMSSVCLVANIQRILDSPRVGGGFSHFKTLSSIGLFTLENPEHYVTALLRFFSNDIVGDGKDFYGWHNYLEAPLFFIGLLPLLLLPQALLLFRKKKPAVAAFLLLVAFLPVVFPYLRYAFFLFSGDYYRVFSLFTALVVLILGLRALRDLEENGTINPYLLLGMALLCLAAIWYPYQTTVSNINIADGMRYPFCNDAQWVIAINANLRAAVSVFLALYTALLLLFRHARFRPLLKVLLLAVVVVETAYVNAESLAGRDTLSPSNISDYAGGDIQEAVNYIHAADSGFYRINVDTRLVLYKLTLFNQSKVMGFYGTASYDSFNQKYYIRFLQEMGYLQKDDEAQSRFSMGLVQRPLSWTFASVKYHIGLDSDQTVMRLGFRPVRRIGRVTVYRNGNFLPFGFTYRQYLPRGEFASLPPLLKALVLHKAVLAEEPVDPEMARSLRPLDKNAFMQETPGVSYFRDTAGLAESTLDITRFSQNRIEGTIRLSTPKLLFFTIPYDKGWTAVVDGKEVEPLLVNLGFTGVLLGAGHHEVRLSYLPPHFVPSLAATVLGLAIYAALVAYGRRRGTARGAAGDVPA